MIVCAALDLDAFFVLAVSVWATTTFTDLHSRVAVGVAFASVLVLLFLSMPTISYQWYWLGARDCPVRERKEPWVMVRWLDDDRVQFVGLNADKKHGLTPWDLGWFQNFRAVMGHSVVSWFFFWVRPSRVLRWENDSGEESDFPLGRLWRDVVEGRAAAGFLSEHTHPRIRDPLDVADAARVPISLLPSTLISRRRDARSTGVDFDIL